MLENIFSDPTWQVSFFGNTLAQYAQAFGVFILLLAAFAIFQKIVLAKLKKLSKKTKSDIDDALVRIVASIRPPFYFLIALFLAANFLFISEFARDALAAIVTAVIVYQVIGAFHILIEYATNKYARAHKDEGSISAIKTLGRILKGVLWVIGLLVILQNLGVNVTSVIAGLGIGGVAIALAAQNILGDLFSSFAIVFDKPFVQGDFIIVGEHMGVVEKIGIKTTRLRALQGEEIVIGNTELTNSRIQNFKKMKERRVVFAFGVVYDTPKAKLKKAASMVRKIIKNVESARLDRVHFFSFGDSALEYEVVYYVKTGDYNEYMDIQQEINLEIVEEFEKEGIEMAFPTRTVYLKKEVS